MAEIAAAVGGHDRDPPIQLIGELLFGSRDAAPSDLAGPLARFFGVPVEYFTEDALTERIETELLSSLLRDLGVAALSVCRAGRTPEAQIGALLVALDVVRDRHVDHEQNDGTATSR